MTELQSLCDAVRDQYGSREAFAIRAGGTRRHTGRPVEGKVFEVTPYQGVIDYHPAELVIRVRAGTTLAELNATLAEQGQMLAFSPPSFDASISSAVNSADVLNPPHSGVGKSTIGGAIATGASGSRRPYAGAARDHVLGVGMILHTGEYLSFGGQVMKNVAGYDVSRLVCGSHGMFGVIADISLKVLPKPALEHCLALDLSLESAMTLVNTLRTRVTSISGCAYVEGQLIIRLSGSEMAVNHDAQTLGGEKMSGDVFSSIDALSHPAFTSANKLWRLSTRASDPVGEFQFDLYDWGFAQRWLIDPDFNPRERYDGQGYWTCLQFDGEDPNELRFAPLKADDLALHQRVKSVFDPEGLFNPGCMYADL